MKRLVRAVSIVMLVLAGCSVAENNSVNLKAGDDEMKNKADAVIRSTIGSGRWFPGNGRQLEYMVTGYINAAESPAVNGRIVAAIAPHAGFPFSGKVAGYTFKAIKDNAAAGNTPDVAVVIGFSHRQGFQGVALMDGAAIRSPMGEVELDKESAEFLVSRSGRIFFDYSPHNGEHSAENEIPFIQAALPGVKLVVAIMGDHDQQTQQDFADALGALSGRKKILVIASTDMLHHADYDLVKRTDKLTLKYLEDMDDQVLVKTWNYSNQVFCGIAPVLTAIRFARDRGAVKGKILYYRNSGDDHPEGRGSWVVGYGSAVFSVNE